MWTQQQLVPPVPPLKLFHSFPPSNHAKIQSLSKLNSTHNLKTTLTLEELPPNALRRKTDAEWSGGFSLGVDLGLARTGVALSKGFTFRPLTVLKLQGQKLEDRIMNIAEEEEADEFIIGLPKSCDGEETIQSNLVRSFTGRLANRAAARGWRVYLHDEYGTTKAGIDRMINMGVNRSQKKKRDAYAAVMLLERYFSTSGQKTELVVPTTVELQGKLRRGPSKDDDYFSDED